MADEIKLLDVVALSEDVPDRGLHKGQVGTVVEELTPEVFEVEFADNRGRPYAMAPLPGSKLIVLHYEPTGAERG